MFGRKLFWLFVGAVGFAIGLAITPLLLPGLPQWAILLGDCAGPGGVRAGVDGAEAGHRTRGFAAGRVAGRLAAGLLAIDVGHSVACGGRHRGPFACRGFEWGLILLSSLVGANLVVVGLRQAISLSEALVPIVFLGLFGLGC